MKQLLIHADGRVTVYGGTDLPAMIEALATRMPPVVDVQDLADDQVPPGRTFRNAWRHCPENGVRHCMPTARDIQRDKMRVHRAGRFAQTDVAIVRGLAEALDTSAVANMASRLRDVTKHPAIEAAETVEDLVKVWPSVLDEPVPALGGPRISGDADYDTKALEEWAQSLNEKIAEQTRQIAALEAQRSQQAGVDLSAITEKLGELEGKLNEGLNTGVEPRDIQILARDVLDMKNSAKAMQERIQKAEEDAAYAVKHALVDARLTEDKLQ